MLRNLLGITDPTLLEQAEAVPGLANTGVTIAVLPRAPWDRGRTGSQRYGTIRSSVGK